MDLSTRAHGYVAGTLRIHRLTVLQAVLARRANVTLTNPSLSTLVVCAISQFKGVRWVLSQTKQQLVGFARAYMFQHRKADPESASVQLGVEPQHSTGHSKQEHDAGAPAWRQSADAQAARAADVVDYTLHGFYDDTSGRGMMLRAMCRFSLIHAFCFVVCLVTLLVALHRVSY